MMLSLKRPLPLVIALADKLDCSCSPISPSDLSSSSTSSNTPNDTPKTYPMRSIKRNKTNKMLPRSNTWSYSL
jgi:hypothetical protein